MRNVVIVAGAGASRAEALHELSPGAPLPPLDTDFFKIASELGLLEDTVLAEYWEHGNIIEARMEDVFCEAWIDWQKFGSEKAQEVLTILLKTLRRVLSQTTDNIECKSDGPMCQLIKNMVDCGAEKVSIITFNYDLVIEKALRTLGAPFGEWGLQDSYGMSFRMVTYPTQSNVARFSAKSSVIPNIEVLKLHGSYNWFKLSKSD